MSLKFIKERGHSFSQKNCDFSPLFLEIPVDGTELTESGIKEISILHCSELK